MSTTLTSTGITFNSGTSMTDIPWYTGSTKTATSLPVGSYIFTATGSNLVGTVGSLNNSQTVYVNTSGASGPGFGNVYFVSHNNAAFWGGTAMSGTWVVRGTQNYTKNSSCCGPIDVGSQRGLYQRIA